MITDDDAAPPGGDETAEPTDVEGETSPGPPDADEEAVEDAPVDEGASEAPGASRRTRSTWLAAAVLVVLAVAIAAFDRLASGPTDLERRQEMTDVAEAFTLALTNYDYRDLGATRDQVLDLSVRGFQQEFDRLLGGSGVQQALTDNQAVATATVAVGPLVADFGEHEARTFAVVQQSVTGAGTAPTEQRLRVEVLLVETPDGWIVTGAEVT